MASRSASTVVVAVRSPTLLVTSANLAQAASLDLAEGRQLEGSMIGLLWGNNALFGAFSPLLLGIIIAQFSPPGLDDYRLIFPYATVLALLATVAALFLPQIGNPRQASAQG